MAFFPHPKQSSVQPYTSDIILSKRSLASCFFLESWNAKKSIKYLIVRQNADDVFVGRMNMSEIYFMTTNTKQSTV